MSSLGGQEIVVGITGGIAAYKSAELVRLLKKQGASVTVLMTSNAQQFITPLTMMTLSERRVVTTMFGTSPSEEIDHIAIAERAQAVVIAPATANIIGKMANGIADDFLSTFLLVVRCPVFLAPAMNTNMYLNPIVQENLVRLKARGIIIIEPAVGELACKTVGPGRMAEPSDILDHLEWRLSRKWDLSTRRFLVTAGPTREYLDPVRYISNPSTGKMGFAVAKAARDRGAEVTLISGPSALVPPRGITFLPVTTTDEMHQAVLSRFPETDIVIMTAAVSDYKPEAVRPTKIKREKNENLNISLVSSVDILAHLGRIKQHQLLVGFAAETEDIITNAQAKLSRKHLDFIAVNDVSKSDSGFGVDTNQVTVIGTEGDPQRLPTMSKQEVAHVLLDIINAKLLIR